MFFVSKTKRELRDSISHNQWLLGGFAKLALQNTPSNLLQTLNVLMQDAHRISQ